MNILYDYQIFAMQKYGGISRYFYEIIQRMCQRDAVSVYAGRNANGYGLRKLHLTDYRAGKTFPHIPHSGLGRLQHFLNRHGFRRYAQTHQVDIYHPTYYDDLNIHKGRLVVTVHDMIHELYPQWFGVNNATTQQKKRILSHADGIVAISENTKRDLMRLFDVPESKIRVIYEANSMQLKCHDPRIVERPYILFVGMRAGYKNFANLLQAFAHSSYRDEVDLVCFGGGALSVAEQAMIHKAKLDEHVRQMAGADTVLANLYTYAEALIYPSQYEGFGLPPLEAMHYGTPVLVSNASCIPEIVGDAGLYFDPLSVEDMQAKIDTCLGDIDLRKNLAEKGYQREKCFSWDKCVSEMHEFYREIMDGSIG